jgi:hypothetical protein
MTLPYILLGAIFCYLLYDNLLMAYKIGYYEQKFKNLRDYLPHGKWEQIERVMKAKNLFKL